MFYTKKFTKNIDTNFLQIVFHNKIYKYFLKKFKIKLTENMNFFNSVYRLFYLMDIQIY